jgi:hypothetical protein
MVAAIGLVKRTIILVDTSKLIMFPEVLSTVVLSFANSVWVAGYLNIKTYKVGGP